MTTITAPRELIEDVPAAARPRPSGWNDRDHLVWGLVRDPEAVLLPLCLGAFALAVSMIGDLAWFSRIGAVFGPQASDVHRIIDAQSGPRQLVPQVFFAGGGAALAVAACLGVLVAMTSRTVGVAARRLAVGLSSLGVVATLGAAQLDRTMSFADWLDRTGVGFWVALGGFGLVLLAGVIVRPATYGSQR
ncbi:hypothetical protein [Jatrophihabitans fulvus]